MIYKMIHQSTKKDGLSTSVYTGTKHYFWIAETHHGPIRNLGWYTHGMGRGVSNRTGCDITSYIQQDYAYYRDNQTSYE